MSEFPRKYSIREEWEKREISLARAFRDTQVIDCLLRSFRLAQSPDTRHRHRRASIKRGFNNVSPLSRDALVRKRVVCLRLSALCH